MLKIRCHLNLGQESLGPKHGTELGVQDFEGDATLVSYVSGEEYCSHTTSADFALDGISSFESRAEARVQRELWIHRDKSMCERLAKKPFGA